MLKDKKLKKMVSHLLFHPNLKKLLQHFLVHIKKFKMKSEFATLASNLFQIGDFLLFILLFVKINVCIRMLIGFIDDE